MSRPLRLLGAVTAAYSAVIVVAPDVLAGPSRLTDAAGRSSRETRLLVRAVGIRDTAIGVAMMVAPPGAALTAATAARIATDAGDAVAFGIALPSKDTKLKIAGFAAMWAALNAAALVRARHRGAA
jgi:hypothetical protein